MWRIQRFLPGSASHPLGPCCYHSHDSTPPWTLPLQVMRPFVATRRFRALRVSSCFLNSSILQYVPDSSQLDNPPPITMQRFLVSARLGIHLCTHQPFFYRESLNSEFTSILSVFSQDLIRIPRILTQTTNLCKQLRIYSGEASRGLSKNNMYNYRRYTL